ncbi:hypothetical protein U4I36_12980 [Stenotrophomonas maltophilia]|uniref:hypothetical protein n=1 Tax=Stenotrophomonas maltophilia group TaxID=995085 RepID=UPI00155A5FEC|nr:MULTISPECIES: hypothetical protein [Stenotrophomonas maltophilia group]MBH1417712.1 hypothetical protein [Stenotrophomonas maltophilia]MBH1813614.1 hypothetical protein [Stenotrophomonas maltophilia]MBH1822597.1 hypothetical protein [Stenotrophomonas maltophilia]MDH2038309.1 hypothetical protein [Stenotrophomonas maltophilia]MDT3488668.1 hypothetical protein [Stenotrophomonas maltophilia group sp. msm4]
MLEAWAKLGPVKARAKNSALIDFIDIQPPILKWVIPLFKAISDQGFVNEQAIKKPQ